MCVFLGLFVQVNRVLMRKESEVKYHDFLTQKEDFDVLFFGNSHTVNGVSPMQLWHDYGIVSYNCAGHANRMPTTYYMMREFIRYHKPKLVVLDVNSIEVNEMVSPAQAGIDQQHISFDWMPLSRSKMEAISALFDNPTTQLEFAFPFALYHDRWDDLGAEDFAPSYSSEKGAEGRVAVETPMKAPLLDPSDASIDESGLGVTYFKKMIELCQSQGIEVLLINIPYPAEEEYQRAANAVPEIAQQYGVNFVNLQYAGVVDFDTDCFDSTAHLNVSGMRKVTAYLGEIISTVYPQVTSRADDPAYAFWNEDYAKYKQMKVERLRGEGNLMNYLMLLNDSDFEVAIYLKGQKAVQISEKIPALLHNIYDFDKLDDAVANGEDFFAVVERGKSAGDKASGDGAEGGALENASVNADGVKSEADDAQNAGGTETSVRAEEYTGYQSLTQHSSLLGDYQYISIDTGDARYASLVMDDHQYILDEDEKGIPTVAIVVYDTESGEIIDHAKFRLDGDDTTVQTRYGE